MKSQTWTLATKSENNRIGHSKGQEREQAKKELRDEGKSVTSTAMAAQIGMYNVNSMKQYVSTWYQCGQYARETYGLKSIEQITGQMVIDYLDYKLELGNAQNTLNREASALGKLAATLEKWNGKDYEELRIGIEAMRVDICEAPHKEDYSRAYERPQEVMKQLTDNKAGLALKIIYESGLRIAEGTRISSNQLMGIGKDPHTGKSVGIFRYIGKGGKHGIATTTPDTYSKLISAMEKGGGKFEVGQKAVRNTLQKSVLQTGQIYEGHGVHGLRWTHAQERMIELQVHGMPRDLALATISKEMNHERPEITELYLK
jgi:integrase